jgi:WD40 repeat protein
MKESKNFNRDENDKSELKSPPDKMASSSDQAIIELEFQSVFATLESSITSISISPDGRRVVAGLFDGSLRLFDFMSGQLIRQYDSDKDVTLTCVSFSPDGKYFVTGSRENLSRILKIADDPDKKYLRLWNLGGKAETQFFLENDSSVDSVAFSPNSEYIVSGHPDGTIRLWRSGKLEHQDFNGHTDSVSSVVFSADGKFIASGSCDGSIKVWNLNGVLAFSALIEHIEIKSVAFSPNGKYIVSAGQQKYLSLPNRNTIILWKLNDRSHTVFSCNYASVNSVAFSPDGRYIVSGDTNHMLSLWDLEGDLVGQPFYGHSGYVTSVAFSPNGQFIVSGSQDKTIRLWQIDYSKIERVIPSHNSHVNSLACSQNGEYLVSGGDDGSICLWHIEGEQVNLTSRVFSQNKSSVKAIACSLDGKIIVSGSQGKRYISEHQTLQVWRNQDGKLIPIAQNHLPFRNSVNSIAFSPDGALIVIGSEYEPFLVQETGISYEQSTLQIWSNQDGVISQKDFFTNESEINSIYETSVSSVAFSPDGKYLICNTSNNIYLWDSKGNLIQNSFEEPWFPTSILTSSFSPNGELILGMRGNRDIYLWNLKGKLVGNNAYNPRTFEGLFSESSERVNAIMFSPKKNFIASGNNESTINFWNFDGEYIHKSSSGHKSSVNTLAFSSDGEYMISGSDDTSIQLSHITENYEIKPIWISNPVIAKLLPNLTKYRKDIAVSEGITSDLAKGQDSLDIKDEIDALCEVLLRRSLEPPMAIGILGNWGSGKSFAMHLMKESINRIRCQKLTKFQAWGDPNNLNDRHLISPNVGHIYQIQFNAWTYAKSDLWASLMQEIFYELDRQISLEQKLGNLLVKNIQKELISDSNKRRGNEELTTSPYIYLNLLIITPFSKIKMAMLQAMQTKFNHLYKKKCLFISFFLCVYWISFHSCCIAELVYSQHFTFFSTFFNLDYLSSASCMDFK